MVLDRNGAPFAYVVAELDLTKSLQRILSDTSDLDESGKMYLVTGDGGFLYHSSPEVLKEADCYEKGVSPEILKLPYWQLHKRNNCLGTPIFSISAPIPEMDWVLIAEIDKMQALKEFQQYIWAGSATAITILVIILIIAQGSAKNLTDPFDELARVTRHISEGNHQERLPVFKDHYLNDVGKAFNTMLDTLEENKRSIIQTISLSAVGKLSSSIVHEMRNPLSSVKINLQALARKVKDDPAYTEMASIALMQVKRLESMFSDLLHFSKPIQLELEDVSFAQLAAEVREILSQKAADNAIVLEVNDYLGDIALNLDKKHIVLALINLVDNAIQWSPPDSIVRITGKLKPNRNSFVIEVEDSGPGLRDDQLGKLFQPFYTTREKGTGLGLANVKKIVEFHGGTVMAHTLPHGGAQFSMIFKGSLKQ